MVRRTRQSQPDAPRHRRWPGRAAHGRRGRIRAVGRGDDALEPLVTRLSAPRRGQDRLAGHAPDSDHQMVETARRGRVHPHHARGRRTLRHSTPYPRPAHPDPDACAAGYHRRLLLPGAHLAARWVGGRVRALQPRHESGRHPGRRRRDRRGQDPRHGNLGDLRDPPSRHGMGLADGVLAAAGRFRIHPGLRTRRVAAPVSLRPRWGPDPPANRR